MIKRFITILIAFSSFCAVAQKRDYTWLTGYSSQGGFDSIGFNYWFGISHFDFNEQPVELSYDSLGMNFQGANMTMSDNEGNLQFYTNGITIRNSLDEIIENGDSLHDGFFLRNIAGWHYYGNPNDAIMCVLPNPIHKNRYDILYGFVDTTPVTGLPHIPKLLRTQVDMNTNLGRGSVLYKDQPFNSVISSSSLAAVRHANGRDWWLVTMKQDTNCYQIFLYDGSDSIKKMPLSCLGGLIYQRGYKAVQRFSPDGRYMESINGVQGRIDFFDFDRCNGILAFIDSSIFPEAFDSTDYSYRGCEFSPNGRYLYVCGSKRLYQFDMLANPISSSKMVISYYNYFTGPLPLTYNLAQLGPDGKIYISTNGTTYYMAVINNPDEAGGACNFQDTVKTPSFIIGLPYYPNYRLGALPGSPCDTITGIKDIAEKEKLLKIFPNPAADVATIDYGYTDWSKGEANIEISNNLGQVVHSQTLPLYSGFQKLEVGKYPSGAYTVYIKRKGVVVATGKLVKE